MRWFWPRLVGAFFFVCPWVGIVLPACGNQGDTVNPQLPTQLPLAFDPDLAEQHRTLKECVAARVYLQRGGVTAVAGKLDMSPSHLSEVLGGGGERNRKFDLDELEQYIDKYHDVTPIQYLIAKYMPDQVHTQAAAMASLALLAESLPSLLAQAGMQTKAKKKKHG